ncbi:MAG: hypothetical protein ACRDGN_00520 [bacterium]
MESHLIAWTETWLRSVLQGLSEEKGVVELLLVLLFAFLLVLLMTGRRIVVQ